MKRLLVVAVVLFGGCAHAEKSLSKVLGEAASMATGPCAAGIVETMAACKTQYPNLPW